MKQGEPVLLFDGVCNLCSASVQFVLTRNPKGNIRFASLQSEYGQQLLTQFHLPKSYLNSLAFLENGKLHTQSDAALRVAKHLRFPWNLTTALLIVPPFIRNPVYNLIARNRYRWFGKKESCWLPQPEWKDRFLG